MHFQSLVGTTSSGDSFSCVNGVKGTSTEREIVERCWHTKLCSGTGNNCIEPFEFGRFYVNFINIVKRISFGLPRLSAHY